MGKLSRLLTVASIAMVALNSRSQARSLKTGQLKSTSKSPLASVLKSPGLKAIKESKAVKRAEKVVKDVLSR